MTLTGTDLHHPTTKSITPNHLFFFTQNQNTHNNNLKIKKKKITKKTNITQTTTKNKAHPTGQEPEDSAFFIPIPNPKQTTAQIRRKNAKRRHVYEHGQPTANRTPNEKKKNKTQHTKTSNKKAPTNQKKIHQNKCGCHNDRHIKIRSLKPTETKKIKKTSTTYTTYHTNQQKKKKNKKKTPHQNPTHNRYSDKKETASEKPTKTKKINTKKKKKKQYKLKNNHDQN